MVQRDTPRGVMQALSVSLDSTSKWCQLNTLSCLNASCRNVMFALQFSNLTGQKVFNNSYNKRSETSTIYIIYTFISRHSIEYVIISHTQGFVQRQHTNYIKWIQNTF